MSAAFASARSLLRIELKRSVGLLAVPLLVLGTWWLVINDVMQAEVRLWPETSHLTIAMAFLLGPAAGGLSAWSATRSRRRGMEEMLSVTARPPFARELATWTGTMFWPLLTCMSIAGFYIFLAFKDATWGRPLPMPLLLGLLYIVAYSAIGYAAGRWVPSRFTAPLVAIGIFYGAWGLLALPPMDLGSLLGPDPNAIAYANVFDKPLGLWSWRVLWALGIGGVALSSVALKIRRSPARWMAFVLCGLVAFGSAATILSLVGNEKLAREYGVYEVKPIAYEPVCEEGRITVCVHPAYEKMLPEIANAINIVAKPLNGISGVPSRMVQADNTFTEPEERNINSPASFSIDYWLWDGENASKQHAASVLVADEEAMMMHGPPEPGANQDEKDLERCGKLQESPYLDPAAEAQTVVSDWLLKEAGGKPPKFSYYQCSNTEKLTRDFATLDPSKRRAWLQESFAGLRVGRVTLKDLP